MPSPEMNLLKLYSSHRYEIDALTDSTSLFILSLLHQIGDILVDDLMREIDISPAALGEKVTLLLRARMIAEENGKLAVTSLGEDILEEIGLIRPLPFVGASHSRGALAAIYVSGVAGARESAIPAPTRWMESPRAITKILLPSKRAGLLHRPRLVDFLHANVERKLLLISASAGYGKTSLLIDFAHETNLPVCWFSMDASDTDPRTFLEYLLAAIRRQFPDFGGRTRRLLSDPAVLRDVDVVVGTLVTEIYETIPGYFVLVLDDYHAVDGSEAVNHLVDSLLRLLPENAHLIISSRTLPSKLTLTRLTARQEIAGLGVADLRFSADEIRALVQENYHVELSMEDAAQLAESSEGWISAILLTTQSLWQGLLRNLVRVQGPHSHVFSFLADEVLGQQPSELQRFLLDSSILDQLDPATCNQLLGIQNSADMMRVIEQRNLFIVKLEEKDVWYRYHHLFQEFLQARLVESDATRWLDLNRRAAALFEGRGAWDLSVAHYLKARAFDEIARVVQQNAKETFDAGRWTTLAQWIDVIPAGILVSHPDLLLYRAQAMDVLGDRARAIEAYARVIEIYKERGDSVGVARALIRQASCLRVQGRYEQAIEYCESALRLLTADNKEECADAHRILGICHGFLGNLDKDIAELKLALENYESLNDSPRIALLHHDLGVAYQIQGTADSQKHFEQALEYWRRTNNSSGLANTLNSIGVEQYLHGTYAQAIETLESALVEARRSGQLRAEGLALASLGDVYRDMGELAKAQQLYQTAYEINRQINEGFIITFTLIALGETYRLLGDLPSAKWFIRQASDQAESHRSNYEIGLTKTAQGILHYTQGDVDQSVKCLEQAIELLERAGAKRDNARAHLHLAQAHFRQRQHRLADLHLKVASDLGSQLGEDQFAVGDAKSLLPLIRYAVSKAIGNGYYAHLLEKLDSMPAAIAEHQTERTPGEQTTAIEARAFGTASVSVNGRVVTTTDWDSATATELFFFLLANGQGLTKEQILSALWGSMSRAKASGIFHSTAYRIRRAISAECLLFENGLYRINPELGIWYDVSVFNRLINEAARTREWEKQVQFWRQAIGLYKGDYLEELYNDWCIPNRTYLLDKYVGALDQLASRLGKEGKSDEAIAAYQQILTKDNLREDTYGALMRLQIRVGDRSGALKTYRRCVQVLQKEMGVEPASETRQLLDDLTKSSNEPLE